MALETPTEYVAGSLVKRFVRSKILQYPGQISGRDFNLIGGGYSLMKDGDVVNMHLIRVESDDRPYSTT